MRIRYVPEKKMYVDMDAKRPRLMNWSLAAQRIADFSGMSLPQALEYLKKLRESATQAPTTPKGAPPPNIRLSGSKLIINGKRGPASRAVALLVRAGWTERQALKYVLDILDMGTKI